MSDDEIPCGCAELGYRADMDWDELFALHEKVATCTSSKYKAPFNGGWVCGNIDKLFRKADLERQRKHQYNKRKKREGYSEAEIKQSKPKTKKLGLVDVNAIL